MTFSIEIRGVVQGVGFRPFIYNLALSLSLKGYVLNNGYGVLVVVDTPKEKLQEFITLVEQNRPLLSKIDSISVTEIKEQKFNDFVIKESKKSSNLSSEIPSDIGMCRECRNELEDKNNRRYNYPFISCVSCGPRYSIIKNLPYDRKNTSMAKFEMCQKCQAEYENPKDRRYHAQPIGCHECGMKLSLLDSSGKIMACANKVDKVVELLACGNIVAIKGIGGYHLVCDGTNDNALKLLRERKQRPSKPFAVMLKDIDSAKKIANIDRIEENLLNSNRQPIVLLEKLNKPLFPAKTWNQISDLVAPNINQIGIFLAYTPLHHLILKKFDKPIVATSANISSEPLCRTFDEIIKLSNIWDYCLDNDRDIVNSCDDSVVFVENETMFMGSF
ncbi:MAG: carbamoyltransferase HypF [Campylobacterota bacterium]|nr:carbamoyltransferase HypF [Campylobacterota bacterium]